MEIKACVTRMFVYRKIANAIFIAEKSKKIPPDTTKKCNQDCKWRENITNRYFLLSNNNVCCSKSGKTYK